MFDIVPTCIIFDNLCIINNEGIEDEWIVEIENKWARRVREGEIQNGSEC